jgi:serpin B
VWVQAGLALRAEFVGQLKDVASATLEDADFAREPEAARGEINRVIAEQTAGKITGLLGPGTIDDMTRLVLASAIYLKASWARPFPENATGDEAFYPEGRDRPGVTVRMMHGTASRDYLRGDGYQAVLLPYANARLAMAVVLPDGPVAGLGGRLAEGGLRGLLAGAARHQVTLAMPRFRLEASFELIPVLRRLGVHEAFESGADFSGITDAGRLKISAIAHKAYIDVDEHGTEAAAATAAVFAALAAMRPPPPFTMVVDRPFLFAIIETSTGLPLFLGQVTHPRSS